MTNKISIIQQTNVLETKLAKLQTDINAIQTTNHRYQQLIESHEQKIQALYQSNSWGITAPMRWFFSIPLRWA
jgi:hypothetical protein